MQERQPYTRPQLKQLGSVADLTRTGLTQPGADAKQGSRLSKGG